MATEVWRDFDPNLEIPMGLKNARVLERQIIEEEEFLDDAVDDDADDDASDELPVPDSFSIVEQVVRTAPDGAQVVDVIIEVEEVDGAINYQFRVTK